MGRCMKSYSPCDNCNIWQGEVQSSGKISILSEIPRNIQLTLEPPELIFCRKEKHLERFLVRKILETKLRRVDVSPGTSTVLSLSWPTVFWPFVMATEITCLSGQGVYMNEHRTRRQCRWVAGHKPTQIWQKWWTWKQFDHEKKDLTKHGGEREKVADLKKKTGWFGYIRGFYYPFWYGDFNEPL